MIKKDEVISQYGERFVKTTILYANSAKALFYDKEAKTDKVMKNELTDLFLKGVVVLMNNIYYSPVALKNTGLVAYDGGETVVTFTAA